MAPPNLPRLHRHTSRIEQRLQLQPRIGQKAFFFDGTRYLGTDRHKPSVLVRIYSQSKDQVVLAYPLYHRTYDLPRPYAYPLVRAVRKFVYLA